MSVARVAFVILVLAVSASLANAEPDQPADKSIKVDPEFARMGTVFYVDDPEGNNQVTFKSSAPLEDIVGTSDAITGYLVFDPAHPDSGGAGELSVPVTSINTGIPMRDSHLQGEPWLDAATYPDIALAITGLKEISVVKTSDEFQTYDVTITGEFTIHGTSKSMEIPGRVTYLKESEETEKKMDGDLLAARATFDITLADFGITGPEGAGIIGSKVGETVTVEVSIMGSTTHGNAASE
jgi:polyisoprenoid-binding protein YceI